MKTNYYSIRSITFLEKFVLIELTIGSWTQNLVKLNFSISHTYTCQNYAQ
jgi:hypothetical protein